MIRFSMLALAVASFCFVTPAVKAEETAPKADAPKVEVVEGVVEKVVDAKGDAAEKAVFVLKVGEGDAAKLVEITVVKETKYVNVDGKEVKCEEVIVKGAKLKVSHTANTASKVEATK